MTACKPRIPVGILSESEMEDVLYDYHLAQSAAEHQGGDVNKARYIYVQSVFTKHGITEAEFDTSLVWYSAHTVRLQKVYERLNERYDSEMKSMGVGVSESEVYANMREYGDTANIWKGNKVIVLQNNPMNCLSTITLKADSTFLPGDNYSLFFRAAFTNSNHGRSYTFLQVHYKDGSSKCEHRMLHGTYDYNIPLPDDINNNNRETDHINITFYYSPEGKDNRGFLCIENPVLARYHKKNQDNFGVPEQNNSHSTDSIKNESIRNSELDSLLNKQSDVLIEKTPNIERQDFQINRERKVNRPMRPVRKIQDNSRRPVQ